MITANELRAIPLFATLPDTESTALAARLADIRLHTGEWLVQEGEQPSFFMVVDGSLDVRKIVHGSDRQINVYRPGDYFDRNEPCRRHAKPQAKHSLCAGLLGQTCSAGRTRPR